MKKNVYLADSMIEDGMIIGLGMGEPILELAERIAENPRNITVVATCQTVLQMCKMLGIPTMALSECSTIDIAFECCDEVDSEFNALVSRWGTQVNSKIMAKISNRFVILADHWAYYKHLRFKHSICLEVVPEARSALIIYLSNLGALVELRESDQKAGYLLGDHGGLLLNAKFPENLYDLPTLYTMLGEMPGLIDHSLFVDLVDEIIVDGEEKAERYILLNE